MVTVPAFVWRCGSLGQAVLTGLGVGVPLAALAWIDSGMWLAAVVVMVTLTPFYGIWTTRRMARYWPGAKRLIGDDRATVARIVRRGKDVDDRRLAPPVIDYRDGLHAAAEKAFPFRWLWWLVLIVAVGVAAWDMLQGSVGNGIASCIYLVLLLLELFWWPKRRRQLLSNADRAAATAQDVLVTPPP
jgi:hypothetical protein